MDRLVAYDPGPKVNPVTLGTEVLASQAAASLKEFLAFQGSDFYGETSVRVYWAGGQIKRVVPEVRQSVVPDA